MRKASRQFKRGALAGILAMGALNSILYLFAPQPLIIGGGYEPVAAVNFIVAAVGAFLLYRHETRAAKPGAA